MKASRRIAAIRRPRRTPRGLLASIGPSAARTQAADLGGAKGKAEDAAARSVSAAARSAWGVLRGLNSAARGTGTAASSAMPATFRDAKGSSAPSHRPVDQASPAIALASLSADPVIADRGRPAAAPSEGELRAHRTVEVQDAGREGRRAHAPVRERADRPRTPRLAVLCASLALLSALLVLPSAALAAAPSVSVEAAEVGFTSAEAKGTIDPGGSEVSYHYEYVTDAQFNQPQNGGFAEAEPNGQLAGFNSTSSAGPAEPAQLGVVTGPLAAATLYHLRLVAEGPGGSTVSTTTFETQPASAAPVTIDPVDTPSYTKVHASGTVAPEGGNVNPIGPTPVPIAWEFQVNREGAGWEPAGGTPAGGSQVIEGAAAESPTAVTVEEEIEGLAPGAHYEIRLRAFRAGIEAVSAEPFEAFTALAVAPPTVTIEPAGSLTDSTAHFTGHVTAGNADAAFNSPCSFEYITDAAFQKNVSKSLPGFEGAGQAGCNVTPEGTGPTAVEAEATGLEPHQAYHLRLHAQNLGGEVNAAAANFTTAALPPVVETHKANNLSGTEATLQGWVNPRNSQTSYWFLWGSEDCSANPCQSIPLSEDVDAGLGNQFNPAHQALTELEPETTYHYLLVAENSAGSVEGEDKTFTTTSADAPEGGCPNEALRIEQHSSFLPDCRAYELVSPPTKAGNDIIGETSRIHAAAGQSPGLPAAIAFPSFGGFSDVQGTGIATEYLAQRDPAPGTQGWSTHAITPRQEPLSFLAASQGQEPLYVGEFSPDLTKAVFKAWSPLTAAPDVKEIINLYTREDLRTPGPGTYSLLTNSAAPLPPLTPGGDSAFQKPTIAGASADLEHVVFESSLNFTADAGGTNVKLYRSDDGIVHLVSAPGGACPGAAAPEGPCSIAGEGAAAFWRTPRVISADGSRVEFTAPVSEGRPTNASRIYQLDDQGTPSGADDATIELSASEKAVPGPTLPASYQTASTDGSRVFFTSEEQLTETPCGASCLYMWARAGHNEVQQLSVDATGGSFTLTAHADPTAGTGTLSSGSAVVGSTTGSFSPGQTVSAPGIPPGTTILTAEAGQLTLSAPATADGEVALSASDDATTPPLPFDAGAAQLQGALESLASIGATNVAVTGAAGSFQIEFAGALAGVDVRQMSADGSALTGGAATATVATTTPVRNLTFIARSVLGVTGASDDGHRVYFPAGGGQLVPGAPALGEEDMYLWQDADGSPSLSFVGGVTGSDADVFINGPMNVSLFHARVTPDGRHLAFMGVNGSGLEPGYQHGRCGGLPCSELYVYSADDSTPTDPDVVCASCDLADPEAPFETLTDVSQGVGTTQRALHKNRILSDDGRYAFFSTDEPLVPGDTNGRFDAYEYDLKTGAYHLLSSGTDAADSYYMESSADGHDVYILTRQGLLGWDHDSAYDLYDVRSGGGFPEPPAPPHGPCEGETCLRPSGPSPAAAPVGSAQQGPGNPKPKPGCPKGKKAVKSRGRAHCVAKGSKKHHGKTHKRPVDPRRRASR